MRPQMIRLALVSFLLLAQGCPKDGPAVAAAPAATPAATAAVAAPAAKAPVARQIAHSSTIHGQERTDEYFWLREKDTAPVLEYLKAENAFTDAAMKPTEPMQKALYEEMLGRIKQTDLSVPYRHHGFWYYSRTEEGKEYPIHCRKKGTLEAAEQVLLDLNEIGKTEKFVGLGATSISDDGNLFAYALDVTGFRDYTLRVKDLRTGAFSSEKIPKVSNVEWAGDGKTLFYTTEDEAKRAHKLWRHVLGADVAKDAMVYEEKDERFEVDISRTRSDAYMLLTLASHTTTEVRFVDAAKPAGAWKTIAPRKQDHEYEVDHRGDLFYILTNDKGRHFRLVSAAVKDPAPAKWKEIIPHRDDVMLEGVKVFKDHYVVYTRSNALPHLEVVEFKSNEGSARGNAHEIAFDEPVYSVFPDFNPEFDATTFRFSYTSFVTPKSVFDYQVAKRERTLLKRQEVLGGYDPAKYASERIYATAADGTKIPVSLVYKKGILRDGKSPMLLYGYGSYGIPMPVSFDSNRFSLIDRGVTFAIAHIRGGGDLGKKWHDGGRMMTKKNTFTDFIACAEHLVKEKYTTSSRLAINGGSAGGLLMGAVMNMRPDLFKVVVAEVPFVDVINTMLDETLPLTVGEFEEWGNPKEKPAYDYMMSYSPYDNVTAKAYPTLLVVSSYNDSQVMYFEPAKWVARLRAKKTDANPLLLRMNLEPAGHGGKSGRYEQLEEEAFNYAFVLTQLGIAK